MTKDEIMNLVNRSLFASIGYTDEAGRQNIRRVFCVWHRGLGRHLVSTNTGSAHVQSLLKNGNACLYFSDDSAFEGLCLFGHAVIHQEREYRELLWNPGDEKYYPKGIGDEDYCVLEFIAESGRFYRYDGKGILTASEMEAYDRGKKFENGYSAANAAGTAALSGGNGTVHRMRLDPAPFGRIKSGRKTIELRLYDEKRRKIRPGDEIVFASTATGETLRTRVTRLHCFSSFEELYQALPLLQCGYAEDEIAHAQPSDMERYYSMEDQAEYGVVGIELSLQEETADEP